MWRVGWIKDQLVVKLERPVSHKCVITATPPMSHAEIKQSVEKNSGTSFLKRHQCGDLTIFLQLITSSMIRCLQPAFENTVFFVFYQENTQPAQGK